MMRNGPKAAMRQAPYSKLFGIIFLSFATWLGAAGAVALAAKASPSKTTTSAKITLTKAQAIEQLREYVKAGAVSKGGQLLGQMLVEFKDQADVHLAAGEFYRSIGASGAAIEQFRNALRQDPRQAEAYYGLAQIYIANADFNKALDNARRALAMAPNSRDFRLAVVISLFRNGQLREADKELSKLFENPLAKTDANANYVAYQIHRKRSQFFIAERYLDTAMALDPKQTDWLADRADIYEAMGDYANERKSLTKLIAANPYSMPAIMRLGLVLEFYFQDYDGAMEQYRKLLKIDPDYADALAGIDRCRAKRNDLAGQLKIQLWRNINALRGALTPQREN